MVSHNHNTTSTSTSTELLICPSSRLSSSSSMRLAKSILSPDKFRDPPQISLSSSLSRRLRTNGSLKGGQSPMFPTGGKKKGGGFENPEPSSPKVTCIGQVRVKSKNRGKKIRSRSQRRGENSFRKIEGNNNGSGGQDLKRQNSAYRSQHHQQMRSSSRREDDRECFPSSHNGSNQKWIHIPVTICETIRAFGAEFNCFLPCRSSCSSGKEDNHHGNGSGNGDNNNSSCGTVFARWLVAVQEGEGSRGRDIELVVGGEDEGVEYRRSYQRRHVMENIDFTKIDEKPWEDNSEKDEEGRVRICVPPKNALLLMRCRSDPLRMAALASKVWDCPIDKEDVEGIDEEEEYGECEEAEDNQQQQQQANFIQEKEAEKDDENINMREKDDDAKHIVEHIPSGDDESSLEMLKDEDFQDALVGETILDEEEEVSSKFVGTEEKDDASSELLEEDNVPSKLQMARISVEGSLGISRLFEEPHQEEKEAQDYCYDEREQVHESERACEEESAQLVQEEEEHHRQQSGEVEEERRPSSALPECLLLMMCEPKLSMEVSRETWVCSSDFVRWLPERKVKQPEIKVNVISSEEDQQVDKKRVSIDCNPAEKVQAPAGATKSQHRAAQKQANKFLPPRSSCSYPAPPPASMAAALEQKLASAYEPFGLTRCKSEPMRSAAAAKYAPTDACFWKNRKLEPHRGAAAIRIGAAGIGF